MVRFLYEHLTEKVAPIVLTWHKAKNNLFHKIFVELCNVLCLTIRCWSWMKVQFPLLFLLDEPEHFKDWKHEEFSSFFKRCVNARLRITAGLSLDFTISKTGLGIIDLFAGQISTNVLAYWLRYCCSKVYSFGDSFSISVLVCLKLPLRNLIDNIISV